MSRNKILAVLTVMVVLIGGLTLVFVNKGASVASAFHDCRSIHVLAAAAKQRGDAHEAYYRQEEANVCEGKAPTAKPLPSAPSTSSSSTSASPSPKSSATSKTSSSAPSPAAKSKKAAGYTFYAWYSNKDGVNNFGPKVAMDPSLHGMPMQKMNTKQALQELKYRYHRDPMLSASTGCAFKLWSCSPSTLQSKTHAFMKDSKAWNTAKKALDRKVNGQNSSVKTLPAGSYVSTYALNGGNYPEVFSDEVHRTSNLEALVFHDGTTLRLICGFQIYWNLPKAPAPKARPKPLPKPSPGMTRTQEGVPEKLVWVCNPATGKQIQVPVSKKSKYPPNTGKCKPMPTTSTPSTTTPGTPTSTSTPPPPTSTSTPPPSSSTTLPNKCKVNKNPQSCNTLPPGSGGKPTSNPPSKEPSPTHTGPTYNPTKTVAPPSPKPTYTRTDPVQPTETSAPGPSDPATGDPIG